MGRKVQPDDHAGNRTQKTIKPADYGKPLKARAEIEALLDELIQQKISFSHPEVITFQKRIIKYRDYLLTFLYSLDVPSHNNASKQAIRNIKVKLKVSGMFKSTKGAQNYVIIRSITDTCKKNQQDILNAFFTIATS